MQYFVGEKGSLITIKDAFQIFVVVLEARAEPSTVAIQLDNVFQKSCPGIVTKLQVI